jgi:hypothetical protein
MSHAGTVPFSTLPGTPDFLASFLASRVPLDAWFGAVDQ